MPTRYKTFLRSCTSFKTMARARKTIIFTGLTYAAALGACERWNANRNARQIKRGTKMEFTQE